MAWCEANGVDYILGLAGNAALHGAENGIRELLKWADIWHLGAQSETVTGQVRSLADRLRSYRFE